MTPVIREKPRPLIPRWRSLLFMPATAPDAMVAKAHLRGADAIIVDLEDGVLDHAKADARVRAAETARQLTRWGSDVVVRINADLETAQADLRATFSPAVRAVVVPKVQDAKNIRALAKTLASLETKAKLPRSAVGLIAMIESPAALMRLEDIAREPRVVGLAFGSEDFSLALGVHPTPANLTLPCQMIALAAAAYGIAAIGLPISLMNYDNLALYAEAARTARTLGLSGALCVHPSQIPVLHEAFTVSDQERAEAERIVAAWEQAATSGSAVVALDGRAIDAPVVQRARMLLAGSF